jgi:hypothetical protein
MALWNLSFPHELDLNAAINHLHWTNSSMSSDESWEDNSQPKHIKNADESTRDADEDITFIAHETTAARPELATRRQKRLERVSPWLNYRHSRSRTLKGQYCDAYRILFNRTVTEATGVYEPEDDQIALPSSQIGVSWWSAEEKEVFFLALSRYGQDNIRAISKKIKGKSEMEVREYLLLLQESYVQHHLKHDHLTHTVALRDIPAAIELGVECQKSLDTAGDALAWYQENFEVKQEQKRHGDYWLLGEDLAMKIEDAVSDELVVGTPTKEDEGEHSDSPNDPQGEPLTIVKEDEEILDPSGSPEDDKSFHSRKDPSLLASIPAARLLNLKNWLKLSRQVFMNSARRRRSNNWRDIAGPDEEPSMYYTAFEDFHRLVISVTRRLVQATIFQTLSRLRAQDQGKKPKHTKIMLRDAKNAIEILGMPRNAREYWITVPRRCGIYIYDELPRPRMSYKNVEAQLRKKGKITKSINRLVKEVREYNEMLKAGKFQEAPKFWMVQKPAESYEDQDLSSTDTSPSESEESLEDDVAGIPLPIRKRKRIGQRAEHGQFKDAERVDQEATVVEEKLIWNMLGREVPTAEHIGEEKKARRPPIKRKEYDELVDWRSWTDYHAEWEGFGLDGEEDEAAEDDERPTKRYRHGLFENIESDESDEFAGVWYPRLLPEDVALDDTADSSIYDRRKGIPDSDSEQSDVAPGQSPDDTEAPSSPGSATPAPRPQRRISLPQGVELEEVNDSTEGDPIEVDSASNTDAEHDLFSDSGTDMGNRDSSMSNV